ncbi:MAG: hypothetical protein KDA28_11600, partial [Phycisphaerales bacterium]|nr:hypothetical protein [Phycisphaerales bacterium]
IDGNVISIGGAVTTTEEGDVTISNTGLLTILTGTVFDLTGNFSQDSTSPVRFNATNLEARRNTILFRGPVTLGASAAFRALNVTFERTIDGASAGAQNLTVRGDGTLVFDRDIGGTTALRDVSIRATGSGDAAFSAIGGDVISTGDQLFVGQTRLLADEQVLEAGGTSTFMDDVRVTGMTHVRSGGNMTFMGAIDGAGGAGASEGTLDLVLTTPLPLLDTTMDIVEIVDAILAMPVVRIMGSVGDSAGLKPLAGLMVNVVEGTRATFDGTDLELTSLPAAPTIIFGEPGNPGDAIPDININADFFESGLFEKVTVYGNANFNVDTLTLGDANILGTLNSTATTLNLLARPQGFVLIGFDDTPSRPNKYLYGPQVNISRDLGSDIVVAGVTTEVIGGTPTDVIATDDLINMPNLTTVNVVEAEVMVGMDLVNLGGFALFSAPAGRASVASDTADALDAITIIQPIEDDFLIDRSKFFTDDVVDSEAIIVDLDLIGRGIGSDNPAVARALAVAASSELGYLPDDTTVGTVNDEAAEALGLNLQNADPSTLIDSIVGFALYNDGANTGDESPGDARITRNRLDFGLVDEVIDEYYRLFWRPLLDENGDPVLDENGEVVLEDRREEIQDAIAAAADDYQATSGDPGFDPRNFNRFVEFSPEHTNASAYLAQLRRLLDTVELLGLSPRELRISRDKILSYARPQFMTEAEFETIVNFDPNDLAAPGLTPGSEAGE